MIFIFGLQPKTIKQQQGSFDCPICQSQTQYSYQVQRSHISLFFLPLFAVGKEQASFKCLQCGTHLPQKFWPPEQ